MKKLKLLATFAVIISLFTACSATVPEQDSSIVDSSSSEQTAVETAEPTQQPDDVETEQAVTINADYIKMLTDGNGAIKAYFADKDYGFSHGIALDAGAIIYMSYYQNEEGGYNFDTPAISFSFADKGPEEWNALLDSGEIGDATSTTNNYPDDWQVVGISCSSNTVFKDVFPDMPDELAQDNVIENLNTYLGVTGIETYIPEEDLGGSTTLAKYNYEYSIENYNITVSYLEDVEGALPSIYITSK